MREGVLMPKLAGAGVVALAAGVAAAQHGHTAGAWLIAAGGLALVTVGLVAWRLVYGVLIASGLWFAAAGVLVRRLPEDAPGRGYWLALTATGMLLAAFTIGGVLRGRSGSRGQVRRWSLRSRRNDGVASTWQLLKLASVFAMRAKATVVMPSLREVSWLRRLRVPTTRYATRLAGVGLIGVWSPVEDVTLRVGGPRTGKSGELAGRILEAPGAVIATSTRTDLLSVTGDCRRRLGPLYVFNPSGLGGLESTITFDPLMGCSHPETATNRAADLMAGGPSTGEQNSEREYWTNLGSAALAALMHAAAIGQLSMRDVLEWLAAPDDHKEFIQRLLRRSTEPTFEIAAKQFLDTNDRTRSSITTTVSPALGWLKSPTAAAAATGGGFDVARLLEERGTVYLLGAEDAQTAPLVTALTSHIAREARRIAAGRPAGRLDPQLTMVLDEAALICPIPLDVWTSDMGGRNITIHIGAQSRAQLKQRFGEAGAASIFNNTGTLLIFGGTKDTDDLAMYSTLAGEREEETQTWDHKSKTASTSTRRVAVLSPAQIAQLRPGQVVIIRRSMPVAIGRVQMAWKRHDVRAMVRQQKRAERYMRWAAHAEAVVQWAVESAVPRVVAAGQWLRDRATQRDHGLFSWLRIWRATRRARAALKALPADHQDQTDNGVTTSTPPSGEAEREGSRS